MDTDSGMGKLILAVLGAVAEFETSIRKERQREGIERRAFVCQKARESMMMIIIIVVVEEVGEAGASISLRNGL